MLWNSFKPTKLNPKYTQQQRTTQHKKKEQKEERESNSPPPLIKLQRVLRKGKKRNTKGKWNQLSQPKRWIGMSTCAPRQWLLGTLKVTAGREGWKQSKTNQECGVLFFFPSLLIYAYISASTSDSLCSPLHYRNITTNIKKKEKKKKEPPLRAERKRRGKKKTREKHKGTWRTSKRYFWMWNEEKKKNSITRSHRSLLPSLPLHLH